MTIIKSFVSGFTVAFNNFFFQKYYLNRVNSNINLILTCLVGFLVILGWYSMRVQIDLMSVRNYRIKMQFNINNLNAVSIQSNPKSQRVINHIE